MPGRGAAGVGVGISEGTVIEYLTDRLLEAEGFSADEIQGVAVPKIPDRMALLGTGELSAAMLPEPLSSLAELQGARVILDDTRHPEYSFSVISFRKAVIDENPQAISGFLAALGGVLLVARLWSAQPNAAVGLELDAIAAPVLGGVSLFGGVGSVAGTMVGAFILGILSNGLNLMGVPSFYQQVIKGVVLILAVMLDIMTKRRR